MTLPRFVTADDLLIFVPEETPDRHAWMQQAACKTADPALFFPEQGQSGTEGLAVCATCPVVAECLDYARAAGITCGVFGGTTPSRRR